MIFASLGKMNMVFDRMARAVDGLAATCKEEVVVQTGYTDYEYRYAKAFRFCRRAEMTRYLKEASVVILQGGWGAISEAMELHKRIVVLPRHDKTEHIHDQGQLVRKLDEMGCVVAVEDERRLAEAVERARTFRFKQLEKGHAEDIIKAQLKSWFGI